MNEFRELLKRLVALIPDKDAAKMIVEFSDFPTDKIDFSGSPKTMWFRILTEANRHHDGIINLINSALEEYPKDEMLLLEKKKISANDTNDTNSSNTTTKAFVDIDTAGLKTLLAKDRITEALDLLTKLGDGLSSDFQNDLILFQARYSRLESENQRGIISSSNYRIEKNKLSSALLSQIDSISTE